VQGENILILASTEVSTICMRRDTLEIKKEISLDYLSTSRNTSFGSTRNNHLAPLDATANHSASPLDHG
jgi:hypothetical protein